MRQARQSAASAHGLSVLGLDIVQLLSSGGRSIGGIAAELAVSQPTVTDAVATLAGHGLVTRGADPSDRRRTMVALTGAGALVADDVADELRPLTTSEDDLGPDHATTLRVLLGEIVRLRAAGLITIDRSCLTCRHYDDTSPLGVPRCLLLDSDLTDDRLQVHCAEHVPR